MDSVHRWISATNMAILSSFFVFFCAPFTQSNDPERLIFISCVDKPYIALCPLFFCHNYDKRTRKQVAGENITALCPKDCCHPLKLVAFVVSCLMSRRSACFDHNYLAFVSLLHRIVFPTLFGPSNRNNGFQGT